MARIELQGISKRFPDGTRALEPTDLVIEDGELFVLVGPSGCGKSTLLRIIVGLERPSTGEILIDGRRVTDLDPKDRGMAMVFQSYALYPHLSVRENIAFPLRMARVPKTQIARRVGETAEVLGLTDLLERRPAASASGWRWVARSCAARPPSCLTSPCRTSTPSSGPRCAPSLRGSSTGSARR